jgi:hypothetical protein
VDRFRTSRRPAPAARLFNLAVAALGFLLMLAFGGWMLASAVPDGGHGLNVFRMLSGTCIAAAAGVLLTSIAGEWRTGVPFQQSFRTLVGIALLGLGTSLLVLA